MEMMLEAKYRETILDATKGSIGMSEWIKKITNASVIPSFSFAIPSHVSRNGSATDLKYFSSASGATICAAPRQATGTLCPGGVLLARSYNTPLNE